jgi:hypothetical protein
VAVSPNPQLAAIMSSSVYSIWFIFAGMERVGFAVTCGLVAEVSVVQYVSASCTMLVPWNMACHSLGLCLCNANDAC